jgi:hypothetical protein
MLGVMPEPRIVAMGSVPDDTLLDYVLGLASGTRLLYVPTASMEDPARTIWWYERLRGRAEMTHLHFFPWPPSGLRGGHPVDGFDHGVTDSFGPELPETRLLR